MLWLLLVVPLLAAGYVALVRRRRRQALAMGALLVRPGVAGAARAGTPAARFARIERHVPPVLLGLALTLAILAGARPSALVTLPTQQQTVILATDVSLSMAAKDIEPTRLQAAQAAAKAFVEQLPSDLRVGLIAFAGTASLVQPPTRKREDLLAAIDRFELQRHTATGSAILVSLAALFPDQGIDVEATMPGHRGAHPGMSREPLAASGTLRERGGAVGALEPVAPGSYRSAAIVLLSDGRRTIGPDPLAAAKLAADRGVRIFTVGFGTAEGAEVEIGGWSIFMRLDEEALKAIAEITKGEYSLAGSEADLRKVYESLTSRLVLERAETEISAFFSAAAVLLALVSAGLSLAWYGRIA